MKNEKENIFLSLEDQRIMTCKATIVLAKSKGEFDKNVLAQWVGLIPHLRPVAIEFESSQRGV